MTGSAVPPTFADIEAAAARLDGVANRTPVLTSPGLDKQTGARVFLKAENLQVTGAFKFRGGYNAVKSLSAADQAAGVVTFSSGNHAQAVARAAAMCGTSSVIVMPHDAPSSKVARTEANGARIVRYDRYAEDRAAIAAEIASQEGRTLIPPYDHPAVIAGQGTTALELFEQVDDIDTMFVCLGGGGLLAGCALAAEAVAPAAQLYGVEPITGDDHRRSREAGERVTIDVPRTIADGQQVTAPGELTWPITNARVAEFLTVSDDAIVDTMRLLFTELKVVVEPSGASALAALLADPGRFAGRRVGVTLSGGNVGLDRFRELTS